MEVSKITVYELKKFQTEITYKDRKNINDGCCLEDENPESIHKFYDKETALKELDKYKPELRKLSGGSGSYFLVTEYAVEAYEADEDGEFVDGSVYYTNEFEWNEEIENIVIGG